MSDVRVRIAPSPTGNLHVGTARTALFNYLYARHAGGKFILRIEDTDLERSEARYVDNIYSGLKALGLQWDEGPDMGGPCGPYAQSERLDIYQQWAQKLIDQDMAYACYLTQDELDAEREQAQQEKRPYVYSGRCRDPKVREELSKDPSRKPSLRFKIPDNRGTITVPDVIRGEIPFDPALIGDFVIMKSNGTPSYNFAVVVDDILMKISDVIRGEDHISNTPKQMLLFEAFGAPMPRFAHVGMILAPDRSKLSKRHGATAVDEFIRQGYLPEAFCNFLALLGWTPASGEEILPLQECINQFGLDRIAHSPAIFDQQKLNWLNGMYLRGLSQDDYLQRARPYLTEAGYNLERYSTEQLALMLDAVREPLVTLSELPDAVSYFFTDAVTPENDEVADVLKTEDTANVLSRFTGEFLSSADFSSPAALEPQLKEFVKALKPLKPKTVMWAIRAATTGRVHGADLSKTLFLLGRDVIEERIKTATNVQTASA